eukprot:scaffold386_cov174-Ochromonas_danica.AAC.3
MEKKEANRNCPFNQKSFDLLRYYAESRALSQRWVRINGTLRPPNSVELLLIFHFCVPLCEENAFLCTFARYAIGYALGRIERDEEDFFRNLSDFASPVTYHGHVASVAVNAPYRKHGVAKALMEELHRRFVSLYNVDSVDLYCRVSNEAAIRLYSEVFSYGRAKLEVAYYEDQEDAWQMRMTGLRELFNGNKASFSSSYGEKSQHKRFLQS